MAVIIIAPDVLRQLAAMPKRDRERLLEALETVAEQPTKRFSFITELVGQPRVWRLREGNWRAVYRVVETDVVLDRAGSRRDVYK